MGGRSRNGWGSIELNSSTPLLCNPVLIKAIAKPLAQCLTIDWPHALGTDTKGLLLWKTAPCKDWSEAMRELALIKIKFRNVLSFGTGFSLRHLLAYPVTKHAVQIWDRPPLPASPARLANQIRFKVVRQDQKLVGVIYHLPCALPTDLLKLLSTKEQQIVSQKQQEAWETVHSVLDQQMQRISGNS